jgi:hypothetical protein
MADSDSLAREFETHRPHLRGVAYRVLGSASDRVAFGFTITSAGRITAIDLIGDPVVLPGLEIELAA